MVDLNLQSKVQYREPEASKSQSETIYENAMRCLSSAFFFLCIYVKLINRRVFHGILKDLVVMFTENVYLEM